MVRIDTAGNVGVGGIPIRKFHVKDTNSTVVALETTSTSCFMSLTDSSGTPAYMGADDGVFKVQTSGGSYSDKLVVDTQGNVKVLASGQGLMLPNALSSSATALDWYEEGTFTPTIIGSTTAGTGTYSVNKGKFTRIGNKVFIDVFIFVSSHTGTGNMKIAGLPFTISSDANYEATALVDYANLTVSGITYAISVPSQTTLLLNAMSTSGGTPVGIPMDTSCILAFSMTYSV